MRDCCFRLELGDLRGRLQMLRARNDVGGSGDGSDVTRDVGGDEHHVTTPGADDFKEQEMHRLESQVMDLQVRATPH